MNSSGIKRLPNWFALQRNCPSTINYCFLETFLDLFWQLLKFRRTWPSMAILSYWVHFVSLRCVKQTSPRKIHPGNIPEKSIPQPPPAVLKMMIFLFPRICILLVPWRVGLPPQPRKVWGFRTTGLQAGKAHGPQRWRARFQQRFQQRFVTAPWADDGLAGGEGEICLAARGRLI